MQPNNKESGELRTRQKGWLGYLGALWSEWHSPPKLWVQMKGEPNRLYPHPAMNRRAIRRITKEICRSVRLPE